MTAYTQDEADQFLMGTGGKSASFLTPGAQIRGYIMAKPTVKVRTDIKTRQVMTWDNGDPQKQLVIILQTEERDPQDPEDNGVRSVYARGSRDPATESMLAAISQAVKTAGGKGLDTGGYLIVQYLGDGPKAPGNENLNAPKRYAAWYTPPSDMMIQQQQAAQDAQQPQQPAPHVQPPAPPQSQDPWAHTQPPQSPPQPAFTPPPAGPPAPQQGPPSPPPPPAPPQAPPPPQQPAQPQGGPPPPPAQAGPPPQAPPPAQAPGPPPPPAPPAPPIQQGAPPSGQWENEEPPF